MLNIDRALNDDRLMKSVIGLSVSEFNKLIGSFGEELQNEAWDRYETGVALGDRGRKPGGGRIGNLTSEVEKLFFTLFYFKCYPIFDLLGFVFGLDRSNTNRDIHKFTPILEKVLGRKMVLPERKIHTMEELLEAFPAVKDLFVDGTEMPIREAKRQRKTERKLPTA